MLWPAGDELDLKAASSSVDILEDRIAKACQVRSKDQEWRLAKYSEDMRSKLRGLFREVPYIFVFFY